MSQPRQIYVVERQAKNSKRWYVLRADVAREDYPKKIWLGDHGERYRLTRYVPDERSRA